MITQPNLDTKDTGGVVGQPVYDNSIPNIIATKSADMTNSDTNINQSASSENLSAKFKNPSVKQSVPEKGKGQYE